MGYKKTADGRVEFVLRDHTVMRQLMHEKGSLGNAGERECLFQLPVHCACFLQTSG